MKKIAWPLLALVIIGACAAVAYQRGMLPIALGVPKVAVKEGTPVKLILMDPLSSGGSKEGEQVSFVVSEDVLGEGGKVAIPKGSRAVGVVSWSRGQGTISVLKNEPARLAVKISEVVTPAGDRVALMTKKEGEAYHFTRDNTGRKDIAQAISKIYSSKEEQEKLSRVLDSIKDGKVFSNETERKEAVQVARDLGLDALADSLTGEKLDDLKGAYADLGKQKEDLRKLSSTNLLFAALEYRSLLGAAQGTLEGVFKGRQIRAFPGTEVPAQVAKTTEVRLP
jgi:hypothetical protein